MSVGNLNTYGDKKSNFPFQYRVLKLIAGLFSGTVKTPNMLTVTGSGTIAAGKYSVAVANTGSADGVLLGQTLPKGVTVHFSAENNNTLGAISYNATGTQFVISYLD
jgi:hypothetical protein